jgi:hypothetical protein
VHGGIVVNEHIEADGDTVFAEACRMGLEGIVSKRLRCALRSGRSGDWIKTKNPDSQPRYAPERAGDEIDASLVRLLGLIRHAGYIVGTTRLTRTGSRLARAQIT